MATYAELLTAAESPELYNKVRVAIIVKAGAYLALPAPSAGQIAWAEKAYESPSALGKTMLWAVIAANKDATLAQITGATDAQVQANIDAVADVFSGV